VDLAAEFLKVFQLMPVLKLLEKKPPLSSDFRAGGGQNTLRN
jgi:hypothetical protein